MLPYIVAAPLIFVVALLWPSLMSLHALVTKETNEIRTWLIYWMLCFSFMTLLLVPGVEFLLTIPFTIIESIFCDVYYLFVLTAFILLVNPRVRMLDTVVVKLDLCLDQHFDKCTGAMQQLGEKFKPLATQALKDAAEKVKRVSSSAIDAAKKKSTTAARAAAKDATKKK